MKAATFLDITAEDDLSIFTASTLDEKLERYVPLDNQQSDEMPLQTKGYSPQYSLTRNFALYAKLS